MSKFTLDDRLDALDAVDELTDGQALVFRYL